MKPIYLIFSFLILLASCSTNPANIDNSLKKYFDSAHVEGTFAMMDNQRGDITIYNLALDTLRLNPGSSFKIMATLAGVQTGVIADDSMKLNVDTTSRTDSITLQQAFQQDNVAYFQEISRRIGKDNLRQWMDSVKYGNEQMNGAVDSFWLNGSLKISADEQLGLMFKLYFDKLPFQKYAQSLLRNAMLQRENTLYSLHYAASTSTDSSGNPLAWVSGWVEENRHVFFFVTLIRGDQDPVDLRKTAEDISNAILKDKGYFEGLK